jgi:xanthine dehydrogenase accessory factor
VADEVVNDWPHRYLAKVGEELGARDAVCVLTHDHKFDIPLLKVALETPAGYIGAMGSRRTNETRAERLKAEGITDEQLARVKAPIGLDIGSRSPEEVAVAVAAEIVDTFRKTRKKEAVPA